MLVDCNVIESPLVKHHNPLSLYDNLIVKSRRVGEDNAHSKVIEKYSKMIDVYKKEN
jgi:hypothetical protein